MQDKEIPELIRDESFLNYCFGRNAEDIRYWEEWLIQHPEHRQKIEELKSLAVLLAHETKSRESEDQFLLLRQRISSAGNPESLKKGKIRPLYTWLSVAASLIVICSAGLLFYFHKDKKAGITNAPQVVVNDIGPGGNKAVLILSNGKKISLTDASNGAIAKQGGNVITKASDGKLVYVPSNQNVSAPSVEYNTVQTPRGGQYQVRLPDGTNVWLNAASSLKYPASFANAEDRKVELSGEGYFEVARDKEHPFIVKTAGQEVRVLGTSFNISAYSDESRASTTLIEGSVKVRDLYTGNQRLLMPGEQANVFENSGRIEVSDVNPGDIIAWKSGYFIFDNKDITSIMKVISRWYDVDIIYKSPDTGERFGGTFSKSSNLSDILKNLEKLGKNQFKVSGRRIIVSDLY